MAILGVRVQLREVVLKAKPNALLSLGGSSTVPQLLTQNGERLPQSLDVIFWSLAQTENHSLAASLWPLQKTAQQKIVSWLNYNDRFFKYWLDRYKYADRHPDFPEQYYRMRGEVFLARLEARLSARAFIMGDQMSLADICLFPFIRQFAAVDSDWFNASKYEKVQGWLSGFLMSESFSEVMKKYPAWEEGQEVVYFPR